MPTAAGNQQASAEFGGGPAWLDNGNVGALVQPNFQQYLFQSFVLTANATILQPLSPPARGARLVIKLIQDGTGSRTVTWSSIWRDMPNLGSSGPAGSSAMVEILYDGFSYQFVGGSSTFAVGGSYLQPGAGAVTYVGTVPVSGKVITPTVGSIAIAGVAPTFAQNATYIAPGAGNIQVRGEFPVRTP